jgi:sec-independent protein translocase protein TatA
MLSYLVDEEGEQRMDLGPLEVIVILAVVVMIFGVGKIPQVGSALGKSIREFRKASNEGDEETATAVETAPPAELQYNSFCTECGAQAGAGVRFCTSCGESLLKAAADGTTPILPKTEEPVAERTRNAFCTQCGIPATNGFRFCPSCGHSLLKAS